MYRQTYIYLLKLYKFIKIIINILYILYFNSISIFMQILLNNLHSMSQKWNLRDLINKVFTLLIEINTFLNNL